MPSTIKLLACLGPAFSNPTTPALVGSAGEKIVPPRNNLLCSQSTRPPVTPLNTNEMELVPIEEGVPFYSPTASDEAPAAALSSPPTVKAAKTFLLVH